MSEIICNNEYICNEDIITLDEISDANNCVAIDNNICTTCETIRQIKDANPRLFIENPIKSVFGIDKTPTDNNEFWELLNAKCSIIRPLGSTETIPKFHVTEPDYEHLNDSIKIIQDRIQQYTTEGKMTNTNASKFITSLYTIASSLRGVNFSDISDPNIFIRNKFKNILDTQKCSSAIIHHATELPLNIEIFLSQLAETSETNFINVANFLDTKPSICLEGALQQCFFYLNEPTTAGGKKKRKTLKKNYKSINLRYLPRRLSLKDRKKQSMMLQKSKKLYKKGMYYTRKPVKSFHSKTSKHILKARKIYGVEKIGATDELAKKSGCTKAALAKIINKGAGAYYSSGSRPNQTAQSWGVARLASALTSGKAGAVDYNILNEGCKPGSKGYKAAQLAKKRYGHGQRRVPKVKL